MKRLGKRTSEIQVLLEGNTGKVMRGGKLLETVRFEKGENLVEAIDTLKKEYLLEGSGDQRINFQVTGPTQIKDKAGFYGITISYDDGSSIWLSYGRRVELFNSSLNKAKCAKILKFLVQESEDGQLFGLDSLVRSINEASTKICKQPMKIYEAGSGYVPFTRIV